MNTPMIYNGTRGYPFKCFLKSILSLSMSEEQTEKMLDRRGLELYSEAFTHKSADSIKNYEYYEFMGDSIVNKAIVSYLPRRFPQLECPEGVVILSRLKINLVSKVSLAEKADSLLFWDFISAEMDIRNTKKNVLLEDTFESFFGVTEKLVNGKILEHLGYSYCFKIISKIMDTVNISLQYEDLFDSKTRLKELFDHFSLHTFQYKSENIDRIHHTQVIWRGNVVGKGNAPLKIKAEQQAAQEALKYFDRRGYSKPLPEAFRRLMKN